MRHHTIFQAKGKSLGGFVSSTRPRADVDRITQWAIIGKFLNASSNSISTDSSCLPASPVLLDSHIATVKGGTNLSRMVAIGSREELDFGI